MKQEFTTTILQIGKRQAIRLPFDPNMVWGKKQRHDVTGTINGVSVRGALEQAEHFYSLALGPAWFRDSGIATDATVTVTLEAEGPQIATMAADLQRAFADAPTATSFFNSLPTFYRKIICVGSTVPNNRKHGRSALLK